MKFMVFLWRIWLGVTAVAVTVCVISFITSGPDDMYLLPAIFLVPIAVILVILTWAAEALTD